MLEQGTGRGITYENAPSTLVLRKIVPHPVSIAIADKVLGQGLSPEGHRHLKPILGKILRGEHVSVGREVLPMYQDAQFKFETEGNEHIPKSGTTLFIGNHEKSRIIGGMGHFIEAARVAYESRGRVENEALREPQVIFQRGLTRVVRLPGGKKFVWMIPLTEQFYQLAAESLDWIAVSPPVNDKNGQITNRQNLPSGVVDQLLEGRALFWFPQGKHDERGAMTMPDKGNGFLTRLKDEDINIVPVMFKPNGSTFNIRFGQSVHIRQLPQNKTGQLDINHFAQNHLEPLGK